MTNQLSDRPRMSHNDLKVAANQTSQESTSEMQRIYNDLFNSLDAEGKRELVEAQNAWKIFAGKQATFSSGVMRGGTGASLIYLDEINSLTLSRVAALREALTERAMV